MDAFLYVLCALVFVPAAITAVVVRRRGGRRLGLGVRDGAAGELGYGVVIGAAAMTALALALRLSGAVQWEGVRPDVARLASGFAVFAAAAVGEEVFYRALILTGLLAIVRGPSRALVLSSLLFGVVHVTGTEDPTLIGVASNTLGGFMYGLAFLRTGRIWMPVGIHFAWNFVQGTVLGFAVSGNTDFSGALLHPELTGSPTLTGGSYGPEAGVVSLFARLAVIAAVILATRKAR